MKNRTKPRMVTIYLLTPSALIPIFAVVPISARAVAAGFAYHITQRGNNRHGVFFVDDYYRVHLKILKEQADKNAPEWIGYCLMRNHVHIITIPQAEEFLARAVGGTHFRYTQYINRFHQLSNQLWQVQFYFCALDESRFYLAM